MASRIVHRPARIRVDPLPKQPLEIPPVPVLDSPTSPQEGAMLRVAMPVVAGSGMLLMMMSSGNTIRMIAGLAMVSMAVIMGVTMFVRSKTGPRKRTELQRRNFLEFLGRLRDDLRPEIDLQRQVQARIHPNPTELLSVVADPSRLYERRRGDADFGIVRIGTGPGELARDVKFGKSTDPAAVLDEIAQAHLSRTRALIERIDGLPLTVELSGIISVVGPVEQCNNLIRAALSQYITLHAPEDAVVHLCAAPDDERHDWIKFAPHVLDPENFDGPMNRRRITYTHVELAQTLGAVISERAADAAQSKSGVAHSPFIVVVVDLDGSNGQQPLALFPAGSSPESCGVCVITQTRERINEPSEISLRITVGEDGQVSIEDPNPPEDPQAVKRAVPRPKQLATGASRGSIDDVPVPMAARLAHNLAPVRLAATSAQEAPLESTVTIEALLGIEDIGTFDPLETWRPRKIEDFLRVPFGVDNAGRQVHLDLKESALEGHGPHGLCIGATGSGKSEVLRTIVLAQAINHPPERLAFVLVDYKGGAAFAGLDILPHTAAMVDNLGDQDGLVDRLHDAVHGEMQRRQKVLQDAGAKNIYDYNEKREVSGGMDPLPNLAVIIDEFGEILVQKPEFLDLFVQIGRIGRSIGVHLLLASQRLEEGRLRGLESHLSYRLGLRTFSAAESRTVIGTTDAHELPALPGSGYLKVDPDVYSRFKAAYVSGRYEPASERVSFDLPAIPVPFESANVVDDWLKRQQESYQEAMSASLPQKEESPFDKIALIVAAERMEAVGTKVNQIWLPPLSNDLGLEEALGDLEVVPERGLQVVDIEARSKLSFPIGIVDDPAEQWQGLFNVDTATSNVMVLGAPQTGKTTTARALIMGSAATHTPAEVAWYLVDAASTSLGDMEDLPHVGGVATRFDPDKIRRAVAETAFELSQREELFTKRRISSADQMRRMVANGDLPEIDVADRYLLVDGWATFASDFEALVPVVTDLAIRGLGYGIHVVIIANRLADMRMNLHTNLGTTIEHRLTSAIDSMLSRDLQQRISVDRRGRIVTPSKRLAQVVNVSGDNVSQAIERFTEAWEGPVAPVIRMLPDDLTYEELLQLGETPSVPVVVGVDETRLAPVQLELYGEDPHLLVFGEGESGRTSLLRTVLTDLVGRSAQRINIVVVDPRRTMLDFVPSPPLTSYVTTVEQAKPMFERLEVFLAKRLPGADVTPAQLRDRSWWEGPEMIVVVDDYDLLVPSTSSPNPLSPLVKLIPHAKDIGLHIVLARKAGGLGRAMFDPVISALRDNSSATILLSGDRAEGQIFTKVYLQAEPPGRGRLIRRGGAPVRAQFAHHETEKLEPPAWGKQPPPA
ncbi:MAG: type VII secretion protein EccCa [Gordonia sp. (in: high G+C Gram-positive bacteria)]